LVQLYLICSLWVLNTLWPTLMGYCGQEDSSPLVWVSYHLHSLHGCIWVKVSHWKHLCHYYLPYHWCLFRYYGS